MLEVAGLVVDDDRGHRAVDGVDLDRARAARCSASPACRATARPSWSRRSWACGRSLAGTVTPRRREPHAAGPPSEILRAGRRLRARGPQRRRPGQGVLRRREPGARPVRPAAVRLAVRAQPRGDRDVGQGADRAVRHPDVVATQPPASSLSGGNQQKVIVAREMSRPLKLFIAAQPTRGVDVGSIEFIHGRIMHERDIGTAVLVVSSELDEVVALADRIAVMYRGRILAIVSPGHPARGDRPADGRHHRGGAPRSRSAAVDRELTPTRRRPSDAEAPRRRRQRRTGPDGPNRPLAGTFLQEPLDAPTPSRSRCWRSCWRWSSAAILIIIVRPRTCWPRTRTSSPGPPTRSPRAGTWSATPTPTCSRARSSTRTAVSGWINGTRQLAAGRSSRSRRR